MERDLEIVLEEELFRGGGWERGYYFILFERVVRVELGREVLVFSEFFEYSIEDSGFSFLRSF